MTEYQKQALAKLKFNSDVGTWISLSTSRSISSSIFEEFLMRYDDDLLLKFWSLLNEFLKERKVDEAFFNNLRKNFSAYTNSRAICKRLFLIVPDLCILHAFEWAETQEGSMFWNELHKAWVDKARQIRQTI
jgi:hypothetical protein